jgi:hypothetical protein
MSKSLIWLEPNSGWVAGKDQDGIEYNDTGLCNRVLHWEIAYEINRKLDFQYSILVEKEYWPELDYINLPNTVALPQSELLQDSVPLSFKKATSILRNGSEVFIKDINWHSNFGYKILASFYGDTSFFHPLSLIKLKDLSIENHIKKNVKNVVGLHIRRNSGVTFKEEDLNTLPLEIKEQYLRFRKNNPPVKEDYIRYIKDDLYFSVIENLLKIDPTQKFYISCDLPYALYSYYKDKYGNAIITKEDLLIGIGENSATLCNIIDLFALSSCKFIIKSNRSSWSDFAQFYSSQLAAYVTEPFEKSIKLKYLKTAQNQKKNLF